MTALPKVGECVRYLGGDFDVKRHRNLTEGHAYEVTAYDDDNKASEIIDNVGDVWMIGQWNAEHYEVITNDSPDTADLIANLALRVARLEQTKGSDNNMTQYVSDKRHAKPGERIVVVNPLSNVVEQGDIFPVESVDGNGNASVDFGNYWVSPEEYEVLPAAVYEEIIADITEEDADDNVEKPSHYTQGKFETIDIIAHIVSGYDDPFVGHCVGTAVKYVSRAPYKHVTPLEDMRKAKRYIEFAIERLEDGR